MTYLALLIAVVALTIALALAQRISDREDEIAGMSEELEAHVDRLRKVEGKVGQLNRDFKLLHERRP